MHLRTGYTTGSCATAAAKAAAIGLFKGNIPDEAEINTPAGIKLKFKIHHKQSTRLYAACSVRKDAGDDPDVTHGCFVHARVERNSMKTIEIDGGDGVGRVTKPGLQVSVGQAAINPTPRRMIEEEVRAVIGNEKGATVVISVPNGRELGEKTFNPKLGIIGGISIIGTTGIVRPMSEEAFKTSLLCGLDIAHGIGYDTVILAPGSLGERTILNLFDIPKDQIIQMSNFVGFMLDAAKERHFKKVILAGHPGKLAKLLNGDFHTHSSVSKPANDILIDTIIQSSSVSQSDNLPETLRKTPTVEGIVDTLKSYNIVSVMNYAAEQIEAKAVTFCNGKPPLTALNIGVILFDMKGSIIGISGNALTWLNTQRKK